jgi:nicotinamide mononucleotide transporter
MEMFYQTSLLYCQQNGLELTGATLTLLCVWLNTQASSWGWAVGIVATACYTYLSFEAKLYGFCLLNCLFVLLSLYGWWHWLWGSQTSAGLLISRVQPAILGYLLLLSALLSLIFFAVLQKFGGSLPWLDAPIFAFSLLAQYLLAQKKLENWILWAFVNAVTTLLFGYLQYWISAVLYLLLFFLALKGYRDWKSKWRATIET